MTDHLTSTRKYLADMVRKRAGEMADAVEAGTLQVTFTKLPDGRQMIEAKPPEPPKT